MEELDWRDSSFQTFVSGQEGQTSQGSLQTRRQNKTVDGRVTLSQSRLMNREKCDEVRNFLLIINGLIINNKSIKQEKTEGE